MAEFDRDQKPDPRGRMPTRVPPITSAANGVRTLLRPILALLGLFLILIAIPIAFLTPVIPVGLPLAIIGVALLGRNSVWGLRWLEGMLARNPKLEQHAPNWLMKLVFRREKRCDLDR